ncbi:MAG: hypothetical protein QM611_10910 [Microbacterium sp.]|uniref:hypothetical protein n=1 Tax=Microbacterium sp. TaxID=51671 RepID=UPI0039E56346
MARHLLADRARRDVALAAALCAVALGALCGCSARAAPSSADGLPAGVRAMIVQQRSDVATRQAQVRIVNGSDQTLRVGDVRVEDARFEGAAKRVVERSSTLPPGARVDVRVQLPPARCPAEDAEPVVVLELGDDGHEARAIADDPFGFLGPLHERECLAEALRRAAVVEFTGFEPSAPGEPATLELTITPTDDAEAVVSAVQETNLLAFGSAAEDGAFPVDVSVDANDTTPVVRRLPLVPFRCDPHAVQEDKRGTVFDVRVEVGGNSGEIELFVGDRMRSRILSWVARWCGFGQ